MKKVLCLCLVFLFCFIAVGSTAEETATADADAAVSDTSADIVADLYGRMEDGNYVNEFLGFGFKLDNWHFFTDEEIDAMNTVSKTLLTEDYAKMMEQIEMLYVMMASAADGTNINIALKYLGDIASVYEAMGMETLTQSSANTSAALLQAYGYEDVTAECIKKTIDGEEFYGVVTSYILQGMKLSSKVIMCIRDKYLVSITVTGYEEDKIDPVFEKLYLIR